MVNVFLSRYAIRIAPIQSVNAQTQDASQDTAKAPGVKFASLRGWQPMMEFVTVRLATMTIMTSNGKLPSV